MSISVDYHPSIGVIQISVDGAAVLFRRDQATELLAKLMRVMADTAPEADTFSRKVSDTPLRLVGDDAA